MDNDGNDMFDPQNAGPIYTRSKINARQVTDGLSHTFAIGEKLVTELVAPDEGPPAPGTEHADRGDSAIFAGDSLETILRTADEGFPESGPDDDDDERFGSEHGDFTHFVYLDGSVHSIQYDMDQEVYEFMGIIADGVEADPADVDTTP
jgi:hypothetical protein